MQRERHESVAQGLLPKGTLHALPGWLDFLSRRLPGEGGSLHASFMVVKADSSCQAPATVI